MRNTQESVSELFIRKAQEYSNEVAVISNNKSYSYDFINRKSNQLAHLLISDYKIRKGSVVAILSEISEWTIISILSILKTGATYLPLDTKYPEERIKYKINDSEAGLIIVSSGFKSKVAWFNNPALVVEDLETDVSLYSDANVNRKTTPDDIAYIMYTSGTTGRPNGVRIPQSGILRLVHSDYLPFDDRLNFLQLAPLGFDASTFEIWGPLLHGNTLVLYTHPITEFIEIRRLINTHSVNCMWLTASLFNKLIDEDASILNGVSYILTGGEALSVKHIKKAQQFLPTTTFINGYGPTECTTFTCCYTIPDIRNTELNSIPIGKPIAETVVYILDEKQNCIPDGEKGELYVGGAGLAAGYLNNQELTEKRFIKYFTKDNDEIVLYKTGDLCRKMDDYNYDFICRIDNQKKINGYRIEISEIESSIKKNSQISDAVALIREDGTNKKIVAYVVAADNKSVQNELYQSLTIKRTIDVASLKSNLLKWLPPYMIPSEIMEVSFLPLTVNGKIDREALLNLKNNEASGRNTESYSPKDLEIKVLCETILTIKIADVSDNFIDLGAQSLSIAQLLYHLNSQYDINIPVNYFYRSPTLLTILQFQEHEFGDDLLRLDELIKIANLPIRYMKMLPDFSFTNRESFIQIKKGAGTPLFIAPGMGGNAFSFLDFAEHLKTDNPVYVFEYPLNDKTCFVVPDIAGLANYFKHNLSQIQVDGSYLLLGYSFGGRLVFEVANLLQTEGKKVDFLGLIDSENIDNERLMHKKKLKFEFRMFNKLSLNMKFKFIHHRLIINSMVFAKSVFLRLISKSSDANERAIRSEYMKIWNTFNPDYVLDCDIHLFKAMNESPRNVEHYVKHLYPDLFIKNNHRGHIYINEIDSNHVEILKPPHLMNMMNTINEAILHKT